MGKGKDGGGGEVVEYRGESREVEKRRIEGRMGKGRMEGEGRVGKRRTEGG